MPRPYIPNDHWSKKAASEGYRARSVYKLQEIDERFHLLHPGMTVLDIGAAPGSWLQYTSSKIGETGLVLGLDRTPIVKVSKNVKTAVCDITDQNAVDAALAALGLKGVDLVLSDIAPNTTGIKDVDQWRSVELSEHVVTIAERVLNVGGTLVMKVFRGKSFDPFAKRAKLNFEAIKVFTASASRDRSREVYVICFTLKPRRAAGR